MAQQRGSSSADSRSAPIALAKTAGFVGSSVSLRLAILGIVLLAGYSLWLSWADLEPGTALKITLVFLLLSGLLVAGLARSLSGSLKVQQRAYDELVASEQRLRVSETWFRSIFENAHTGIVATDPAGRLTSFNNAFCDMLGYPRHVLECMHFSEFTHPEDLPLDNKFLQEITAREREHFRVTKRYIGRDGRVIWVDISVAALRNAQGDVSNFVGVVNDISDRKNAEEELRVAAAAFDSQECMIVTDANSVILRVNRAFTEVTGYSADEVVGKKPSMLQSGRHDKSFYTEMWNSINTTGIWQGEVWDRRKNGEVYPKWLTISVVRNGAGKVTHYIGTHFDITERKSAEEKINELAFYDQLTGLPNRTLLMDRLRQALSASSRTGSHGALLLIDLDNFKALNDTLGHGMGDLLLRQVARDLKYCIRQGDTVARLGGDEFVVVLPDLSPRVKDAITCAEVVAEKILVTLNQSYQLGDATHHDSASIGVTLFHGNKASVDDLMKQADLAMYKSKTAGRNAWHFFDPKMESSANERAALEVDLRKGVVDSQFVLHYQAQVDAEGVVIGAETLVRWQHPERGMVSPAEFIPLAEETGLILPIGHWVMQQACECLAAWASRAETADLSLAVNVSARQFSMPNFVEQVLSLLEYTGAPPQRLKLELTESILLNNAEDIIAKMHELKSRGVCFSMDDFGTGYSSLSYLKRLPLDQLKIDRSFVSDVLTDPNDAAIARTVVALGQSLGLSVIAEGVETAAQREFLLNSGCRTYQGYFFSRPLPLEGFEQFFLGTLQRTSAPVALSEPLLESGT